MVEGMEGQQGVGGSLREGVSTRLLSIPPNAARGSFPSLLPRRSPVRYPNFHLHARLPNCLPNCLNAYSYLRHSIILFSRLAPECFPPLLLYKTLHLSVVAMPPNATVPPEPEPEPEPIHAYAYANANAHCPALTDIACASQPASGQPIAYLFLSPIYLSVGRSVYLSIPSIHPPFLPIIQPTIATKLFMPTQIVSTQHTQSRLRRPSTVWISRLSLSQRGKLVSPTSCPLSCISTR